MPAERSTPVSRRAYGTTSGPHSPVPQPASSTSRFFDRPESRIFQHGRDKRRGAVRQLRKLRLEAGGEAVEDFRDEPVRRARRNVSTGAGRQHVPRNRVVRLLIEPFLEDLHGLVDLADGAVRQRQKSSGFPVLRPQRDRFAEARDRLLASLQPRQENAQVVVRIDVIGVQANGCSIGVFGFDRFARRPQQHAKIAVRIRMIWIQ